MTLYEQIQSIAAVATAVGVVIGVAELFRGRRQAQSAFEDSINDEYRRIARELPLSALLGKPLNDEEIERHLQAFYNYFDLSNEQVFLAKRRRLRRDTWNNWHDGIVQHMARPAFRQAWNRLVPFLDGSFESLKSLLQDAASVPVEERDESALTKTALTAP